jgi:PadR family transcriptional regulator PadR
MRSTKTELNRNLAKGDIPTLILAVLAQGPCHGYAIAREVERRGGDIFRLREGSLYPALRALENDDAISGQWQETSGAPARRVYRITEKGQRELAQRTRAWKQYAKAVNAIIGGKPNAEPA